MKPVFSSEQRFRPGMHVFVNQAFEAFNIPKHTHDAIEISFVTGGTGYQYINDAVVRVKRGDLFLLPVGTSHVYRPSSPNKAGSLRIINCVFRLEALSGFDQVPPPGSSLYCAIYTPDKLRQPWFHLYDQDNEFTELLHSMLAEYKQKRPLYETIVHSMFMQLIAKLHRSTLPPETKTAAASKVGRAIAYVHDHFQDSISLGQVAKHASLSKSHLQRLFKQATGTSFTVYVQHLRIQKCCELLRTTNMAVRQIAATVGYHDMKHFHALFRHHTGTTPQEYRKNGSDRADVQQAKHNRPDAATPMQQQE